jgi:hypothetical protein
VEGEKRKRFSRLEYLILDVIGDDLPEGAPTAIAPLLHRCKTIPVPKPPTAVEDKVIVEKQATPPKPPINAVLLNSYDWGKPVPEGFPDVLKERLQKFLLLGEEADLSQTVASFHRENHKALGMEANSIAAFKTMLDKWQKGDGYRRDYFRYGHLDWEKPRSNGESVAAFFEKLRNIGCSPEKKMTDIWREYFSEDLTSSAFNSRIRDWQYPERKKRALSGDRRDKMVSFMLAAQDEGKSRSNAVYEYAQLTDKDTETVARHERALRREGAIPAWKKEG